MKSKTRGGRRLWQRTGACLMVLLFAMAFVSYGSTEKNSQTGISMSVSYGLDGNLKSGRYMPLVFSLNNQEQEQFNGSIRVLIRQSAENHYLYEREISLTPKEQRVEKMTVPLAEGCDQIYISVIETDGTVVSEELIKISDYMTGPEMYIGVLADNYEELKYLDSTRLYENELITKCIPLTADLITADSRDIDMLDVLLINNYDTARLSKDQRDAIIEWTRNGGILLLGTGNNLEKVRSGFAEIFSDVTFGNDGQAKELRTDLGVAHQGVSEEENYITLMWADIKSTRGSVVFRSGQSSLITNLPAEDGIISLAGFDFGDISAYARTNSQYILDLLEGIISKERLTKISEEAMFGNYHLYWAVNSLISAGRTEVLPNPAVYGLLLVAYILFAGPGLYLLLMRLDKRLYYKKLVLCLSAAVSLLVFFLGRNTRFTEPFMDYVTIREVEEGSVKETSYLNLRAPFNQKYSVAIDDSYSMMPITKESVYYMYNDWDMKGDEDYTILLQEEQGSTNVTIQDVPAFTSQLFQMERMLTTDKSSTVNCDIKLFENQISGRLINNLGYSLYDCSLIMSGRIVKLGELSDGEQVNLDEYDLLVYPLNYSYDIAKKITGIEGFRTPEVNNPDYMSGFERANLLNFYMDNKINQDSHQARLVGFTADRNKNTFSTVHNYEAYGISLTSVPVDVDYTEGNLTYYPQLQDSPKVISGEYWETANTAFGTEPVTLEYSLGNSMEIVKLILTLPVEELEYSYYSPFKGKIYFFNLATLEYDQKDLGELVFTKDELSDYISPRKTITIKYELETESELHQEMCLPVLSVVGGE